VIALFELSEMLEPLTAKKTVGALVENVFVDPPHPDNVANANNIRKVRLNKISP
jgi:hypothetical protein